MSLGGDEREIIGSEMISITAIKYFFLMQIDFFCVH